LGPLGLVLLALFVINTSLVLTQPELAADRAIEQWVQRTNWGPLTRPMELTNWIAGRTQTVLGVATVLLMVVSYPRAGVLMALAAAGSVFEKVLKLAVERGRPTTDLVQVIENVPGHGYPSGHAVFFTWLAFMVAVVLTQRLPRPWQVVLWVAAGLLVFTACLGRVWGGTHWPTDVVGGFLLSLGWCAVVLWIAPRLPFWERLRFRR
jgi:undecaprenyl-diphosphatase